MKTQTTDLDGRTKILDALIDGLRLSDFALNDKCVRALRAIGSSVIPALSAAASSATNARHRRRILETIEMIEDLGPLNEHAGKCVWDALLDALRVHNDRLNEKAIEAFKCFPVGAMFELVTEATYQRRKRGYAQRLMQAVSALGLRDAMAGAEERQADKEQ